MTTEDTQRIELEPWQELFIVVGGEGEDKEFDGSPRLCYTVATIE